MCHSWALLVQLVCSAWIPRVSFPSGADSGLLVLDSPARPSVPVLGLSDSALVCSGLPCSFSAQAMSARTVVWALRVLLEMFSLLQKSLGLLVLYFHPF